jgi:hypothetical protein
MTMRHAAALKSPTPLTVADDDNDGVGCLGQSDPQAPDVDEPCGVHVHDWRAAAKDRRRALFRLRVGTAETDESLWVFGRRQRPRDACIVRAEQPTED